MSPIVAGAVTQWPLVICALAIFGTTSFALLFSAGDTAGTFPILIETLTPLWRTLAIAALLVSPIALLSEVARMASVSLGNALPLVAESLRLTHAGRLWLWRLPALAVMAIAALWMPGSQRFTAAALCGLAAAVMALSCVGGHAIDRGGWVVAACLVHEAAAATWLGALVVLLSAAANVRARESLIEGLAPRVSQVAGWSVAVLAASGTWLAWNALGADPGDLIYSAYGRTLVAKIALFALVLSAGGYNRYRLIPAVAERSARAMLIRNVGVECALITGVIGLAALLANTPPPH